MYQEKKYFNFKYALTTHWILPLQKNNKAVKPKAGSLVEAENTKNTQGNTKNCLKRMRIYLMITNNLKSIKKLAKSKFMPRLQPRRVQREFIAELEEATWNKKQ